MRKLFSVLTISFSVVTAWAASAMAQTYPPTIPPGDIGPGGVGRAEDGIAITGTDITVGMLIMVALFVAGGLALFLGRRRADQE